MPTLLVIMRNSLALSSSLRRVAPGVYFFESLSTFQSNERCDADEFLRVNAHRLDELLRLIPGCQCTIDFSWDFPTTSAGQYNRFPAALLTRLGALGIDMMVSVYGASANAANHPKQPSREVGCFDVDDQSSPPAAR